MSIPDQVAFLHQQITALNEQILFLRSHHVSTLPNEHVDDLNDQ